MKKSKTEGISITVFKDLWNEDEGLLHFMFKDFDEYLVFVKKTCTIIYE